MSLLGLGAYGDESDEEHDTSTTASAPTADRPHSIVTAYDSSDEEDDTSADTRKKTTTDAIKTTGTGTRTGTSPPRINIAHPPAQFYRTASGEYVVGDSNEPEPPPPVIEADTIMTDVPSPHTPPPEKPRRLHTDHGEPQHTAEVLDQYYMDATLVGMRLLPPEPMGESDPDVTAKFASQDLTIPICTFIQQLDAKKDFHNPSILDKIASLYRIDQNATNYDPSVYAGMAAFDNNDYYEALAEQQTKEEEKRVLDRKQTLTPRIDFAPATSATVITSGATTLVAPGTSTGASTSTSTSTSVTANNTSISTKKRKKWDQGAAEVTITSSTVPSAALRTAMEAAARLSQLTGQSSSSSSSSSSSIPSTSPSNSASSASASTSTSSIPIPIPTAEYIAAKRAEADRRKPS